MDGKARVIQAIQRSLNKKPPLVAHQNKDERKTVGFKFKKLILKTFLSTPTYLKLKWRWSRGEIRDRRLFVASFAKMAAPLKRFRDYNKIGHECFKVEDLK